MLEEKNVIAAELALGLLEGREKQEAMHDVTVDPEMREAFRSWNERLASLSLAQPDPVEGPDPQVLARIEETLFAAPPETRHASFWDLVKAPENRGLVVMVLTGKALLLAWIVYLFL